MEGTGKEAARQHGRYWKGGDKALGFGEEAARQQGREGAREMEIRY